MKVLQIACAFVIAACTIGLKPSMLSEQSGGRVTAMVDDRVVSFAVGGGWKYLSQTDSNAVVILRRGPDGSAIGVYFQSAIPGSTIEEATVRWMTLMLTEPTVFEVTDVPTPIVASEEEASFMLYGLDGKSKMVSKCRIKLLGDARSDYWALVFSVSPDDLQLEAFAEVDGIADSLKLEPPQAP